MKKTYTEQEDGSIKFLKNVTVYRENLTVNPLWYHKRNLMQTSTGYGSKLVTEYMLPLRNRLFRVYAICLSNCASFYVIISGEKIFLNIL